MILDLPLKREAMGLARIRGSKYLYVTRKSSGRHLQDLMTTNQISKSESLVVKPTSLKTIFTHLV